MKNPVFKPELLSPAGNCDSLKTAVAAGANSVYIGGRQFGARGYADNFTKEQINTAIDYAHLYNVKVYATLNTLIKDAEINNALACAEYLYEKGVDALIVQDLGLASLLLQEFPRLPIHASTQMTTHNTRGVKFLEQLGFKRVILARELSTAEIATIKQNTSIELEVFVHGALCISYSGQCLFSSMVGGRSGNRGFCAQPCRKKYTLLTKNKKTTPLKGKHLLSPRDLNTSSHLRELADAGVACFKIEGRMKNPEYVAGVTSVYRNIIDNNFEPVNTTKLSKSFNRSFTAGYLQGNPEKLINPHSPKNMGEPLGTTIDSTENTLTLRLNTPLTTGDGIAIHHNNTTNGTNITKILKQQQLTKNDHIITIPFNRQIPTGAKVYLTHDHKYTKSLQELTPAKQPLTITASIKQGEPMTLGISSQNASASKTGELRAMPAEKAPLTEKTVKEQLTKLQDTPFHLKNITVELEDNTFLPLSEINNLRRHTIELLKTKIILSHKRTKKQKYPTQARITHATSNTPHSRMKVAVRVDSLEALEGAIEGKADTIYFGGTILSKNKILKPADHQYAVEQCKTHKINIYLDTPTITKDHEFTELRRLLKITHPDGVLASNPGTLHFIRKQHPELTITTDYTIPVLNSRTLQFLHEQGAHRVTLSPELNQQEIKKIATQGNTELITHANLPLMTLQHCILKEHLNPYYAQNAQTCKTQCNTDDYYLKDEKNYKFPIKTDQYCRNYILNSKQLCLLPHTTELAKTNINTLRIEAKTMTRKQVKKTTKAYKKATIENNTNNTTCKNHTTGHYKRGIK